LRAAAPQQLVSLAIALPIPSHLFWCLILFCNSHLAYIPNLGISAGFGPLGHCARRGTFR
jgi:hypothetical protein